VIEQLTIRHPYVGEVPAELLAGFEGFKIDPEWQWVVVVDGRVKAQMLCANAHGVLMILRLTALPDAPRGWALGFFRYILKECRELGLIGIMTSLSDDTKAQRRLMTIIQRNGGYLEPYSGVWAAMRPETRY
jgi:hypothetical protein